ncbi:Peptidase family M23 [Faunimonas pinastri]|uniref:Peptidase family M23 n=1 Tax=Faunimonas pinastri TaxID=1855383 RepID=A0A1H9CRX2_9HYPH|nr:M23 family metallopeptidase [Faunimonas pinastri]SEQ03871.1 Peptidase family M23 [Faunimonas pinastri]
MRLNEPLFTGSTPNQQRILTGQANRHADSYASADAAPPPPARPAYSRAESSTIQSSSLPAPTGYTPPSSYGGSSPSYGAPAPVAQASSTPSAPRPYAAKGLPTPMGRVASNTYAPPAPAPSYSAPAPYTAPSAGNRMASAAPAPRTASTSAESAGTAPLPVVRGAPPTTLGAQAQSVSGRPMQMASLEPRTGAHDEESRMLEPRGGAASASAAPASAPSVRAPSAPAQTRVASAEPQAEVATSSSSSGDAFRWPVRGRVIASFGKSDNGEKNDGINLAVPEGTPVKAAEDGTVIYAGSELKSYGNLVLVRHANGWVSAYANNKTLKVKRGDQVHRGEVVALSGMSGGVTTPQVHFELRKGATPVDPLPHLSEG